jgi:SHS2 domain-containing protein
MEKKFEFLEHTADIKFRVFGKTLEEVFENSVLAVSNILSKSKKIKSVKVQRMRIEGGDNENFLYSLLEQVIYLFDAENFIVSKAKIEFDETVRNMKVTFYGDDSKKYSGLDHIKAITYNEMFVKKAKDGWEAQVVVDV